MIQFPLTSDWLCSSTDGEIKDLPAQVPGCVHTDLLAAGKLPVLWYRDNERQIHWVFKKDWVYETRFHCPDEVMTQPHRTLRFEGLDTLCSLELNGVPLGKADNMHRIWEWDVEKALLAGENHLRITFPCPAPYMDEKTARRRLPMWNLYHDDYVGKSYLRKMACAFGWDWGLMAPTVGVWRPASLLAFSSRLNDIHFRQRHGADHVFLDIQLEMAGDAAGKVRVTREGLEVAQSSFSASGETLSLRIPCPCLWWPNGMGGQPLYEVEVRLDSGDTITKRVGLRTLELVREADEFGESFRFSVNGRDIFMKGGNWIPCDVFPSRVQAGTYRHLLESCAESHMNMIRVWGGGIYEQDVFYDLCDELGLLVWQDFMFACSTYPAFDTEFLENVRQEAVDNIRRLRHHPCIALWCGNNELEQGLVRFDIDDWTSSSMPPGDYVKLFDELLPSVLATEDPDTPYWPCSPHSPRGDRNNFNNHTCGDAHAWSVWFGGQPLESQRNWTYRFMSEFGFQSYPELKTVESFTAPEDRSLINWVMDFHQRSGPGNKTIFSYMLDWFREPKNFESALLLTQLIQGLCIQYAADHARRIQGRMDGLLYWQINDLWPAPTWSSIDVFGRWKVLQHLARRFFEPVHLSLLENLEEGSMGFHVSNQTPDAFEGVLSWEITSAAGEVLASGASAVEVPSQSNREILLLDCQPFRTRSGDERLPWTAHNRKSIPHTGDRDLMVWGFVHQGGQEISRNMGGFIRPKFWDLAKPLITASVCEEADSFRIDLGTDRCAPWVRLHMEKPSAHFSDNFVHLTPTRPLSVRTPKTGHFTRSELETGLKISSLLDLFA